MELVLVGCVEVGVGVMGVEELRRRLIEIGGGCKG